MKKMIRNDSMKPKTFTNHGQQQMEMVAIVIIIISRVNLLD